MPGVLSIAERCSEFRVPLRGKKRHIPTVLINLTRMGAACQPRKTPDSCTPEPAQFLWVSPRPELQRSIGLRHDRPANVRPGFFEARSARSRTAAQPVRRPAE